MKITFIRGTALGGVGNDAHPGDVRDIPDVQANDLIRRGRAVAGESAKDDRKPARARAVVPTSVDTDEGRN